ncbi:MAG: demethoxyubiquinone hydroxylase family protein [Desulfitobacteriaceae bacterium]
MNYKLISRLKEFYILETFQVAYYEAQLSSSTDEYYSNAFKKMVQIESGHADFFANKLDQAKVTVPVVVGSVFELAGSLLGETVESTGPYNTCKLGVALENKAMETYRSFISEAKDKNYSILRDTLMEYLLDEEFHTLWLRDYMKKLK